MNIIDKLIEEKLFHLMIGLLISSDHLIDILSCEKALETIEKFEQALETSKLADDKIEKYIKDARQIIERDLKLYKS